MAMVHGAMFDAANAIDHRYHPYLAKLHARPWYSSDAAVAAAAHRVLIDGGVVRRDQQAALEAAIEPQYAAALAAIPDGAAKLGGIATGEAAAWAMIAARDGDRPLRPDGLRPAAARAWSVGSRSRRRAMTPAPGSETPSRSCSGVPSASSRPRRIR